MAWDFAEALEVELAVAAFVVVADTTIVAAVATGRDAAGATATRAA